MITPKQHKTFVQRLLYNYGPHNCLKKSKGWNKLKFSRPEGYWSVGKTLGSDLP